jgi:hypothetical protein
VSDKPANKAAAPRNSKKLLVVVAIVLVIVALVSRWSLSVLCQ